MESQGALRRPDGTPVRVLVVDDESDLRESVAGLLTRDGFQVRVAANAGAAERVNAEFLPDLVVLDVNLPDGSGFDLLRLLRTESPDVCVLFLSARTGVQDRVTGISIGGDDYVTKPFSSEEVLARVRGLARRMGRTDENGTRLVVGDLTLDETTREVRRGDEDITLSVTEFELLRLLMANPKHVLSKEQILERVWKYDFGGTAHIIELYISYLRKKIDKDRPPMIHTVRGVGYVLRPAP